jgi:hypothetical protein
MLMWWKCKSEICLRFDVVWRLRQAANILRRAKKLQTSPGRRTLRRAGENN